MMYPLGGDNVSRETLERLQVYHDLVQKWSPNINLVSKSSLDSLWDRHIWDSAQMADFQKDATLWADLGSGGGFPALVLSIIAKENQPDRQIILVESDQRKSVFLRTVIRELGLNAKVFSKRVEAVAPLNADVISARALADLKHLLPMAVRHLNPNGAALFMKGETWEKEVHDASESWSFQLKVHKSKTSPKAAILEIKEIERA